MSKAVVSFYRSPVQILVLFRFAVSRIVRVIGKPRGNMLLVGIGGSGRQSLTRLAAYLIGYKVFQIEVTRNYKKAEFRDGKEQGRAVTKALIGRGIYIHIFMFCLTSFFSNQIQIDQFEKKSAGQNAIMFSLPPTSLLCHNNQ